MDTMDRFFKWWKEARYHLYPPVILVAGVIMLAGFIRWHIVVYGVLGFLYTAVGGLIIWAQWPETRVWLRHQRWPR